LAGPGVVVSASGDDGSTRALGDGDDGGRTLGVAAEQPVSTTVISPTMTVTSFLS
jgi:hypothetical protein